MYLHCDDCGLNKKISLVNRVQDSGDEPKSMPADVQDGFYDYHYHKVYILQGFTVEVYDTSYNQVMNISLDITDPDPLKTYCSNIFAENPREFLYVICKHESTWFVQVINMEGEPFIAYKTYILDNL